MLIINEHYHTEFNVKEFPYAIVQTHISDGHRIISSCTSDYESAIQHVEACGNAFDLSVYDLRKHKVKVVK